MKIKIFYSTSLLITIFATAYQQNQQIPHLPIVVDPSQVAFLPAGTPFVLTRPLAVSTRTATPPIPSWQMMQQVQGTYYQQPQHQYPSQSSAYYQQPQGPHNPDPRALFAIDQQQYYHQGAENHRFYPYQSSVSQLPQFPSQSTTQLNALAEEFVPSNVIPINSDNSFRFRNKTISLDRTPSYTRNHGDVEGEKSLAELLEEKPQVFFEGTFPDTTTIVRHIVTYNPRGLNKVNFYSIKKEGNSIVIEQISRERALTEKQNLSLSATSGTQSRQAGSLNPQTTGNEPTQTSSHLSQPEVTTNGQKVEVDIPDDDVNTQARSSEITESTASITQPKAPQTLYDIFPGGISPEEITFTTDSITDADPETTHSPVETVQKKQVQPVESEQTQPVQKVEIHTKETPTTTQEAQTSQTQAPTQEQTKKATTKQKPKNNNQANAQVSSGAQNKQVPNKQVPKTQEPKKQIQTTIVHKKAPEQPRPTQTENSGKTEPKEVAQKPHTAQSNTTSEVAIPVVAPKESKANTPTIAITQEEKTDSESVKTQNTGSQKSKNNKSKKTKATESNNFLDEEALQAQKERASLEKAENQTFNLVKEAAVLINTPDTAAKKKIAKAQNFVKDLQENPGKYDLIRLDNEKKKTYSANILALARHYIEFRCGSEDLIEVCKKLLTPQDTKELQKTIKTAQESQATPAVTTQALTTNTQHLVHVHLLTTTHKIVADAIVRTPTVQENSAKIVDFLEFVQSNTAQYKKIFNSDGLLYANFVEIVRHAATTAKGFDINKFKSLLSKDDFQIINTAIKNEVLMRECSYVEEENQSAFALIYSTIFTEGDPQQVTSTKAFLLKDPAKYMPRFANPESTQKYHDRLAVVISKILETTGSFPLREFKAYFSPTTYSKLQEQEFKEFNQRLLSQDHTKDSLAELTRTYAEIATEHVENFQQAVCDPRVVEKFHKVCKAGQTLKALLLSHESQLLETDKEMFSTFLKTCTYGCSHNETIITPADLEQVRTAFNRHYPENGEVHPQKLLLFVIESYALFDDFLRSPCDGAFNAWRNHINASGNFPYHLTLGNTRCFQNSLLLASLPLETSPFYASQIFYRIVNDFSLIFDTPQKRNQLENVIMHMQQSPNNSIADVSHIISLRTLQYKTETNPKEKEKILQSLERINSIMQDFVHNELSEHLSGKAETRLLHTIGLLKSEGEDSHFTQTGAKLGRTLKTLLERMLKQTPRDASDTDTHNQIELKVKREKIVRLQNLIELQIVTNQEERTQLQTAIIESIKNLYAINTNPHMLELINSQMLNISITTLSILQPEERVTFMKNLCSAVGQLPIECQGIGLQELDGYFKHPEDAEYSPKSTSTESVREFFGLIHARGAQNIMKHYCTTHRLTSVAKGNADIERDIYMLLWSLPAHYKRLFQLHEPELWKYYSEKYEQSNITRNIILAPDQFFA